MKPLNTFMLVTLDVLLGSVSASADLQKGLTAYKSGDYASTLREFQPLTEQGDARANLADFIGYRRPLASRNINLTQFRCNLFRIVVSPRHSNCPSNPMISGGSTSIGATQYYLAATIRS